MRRELFIGLLLASATILVYGQVADFDFTNLDDGPIIYDNLNVRGGLTFHGVLWALSTSYFDFWHPLTWWSHMLDCTLFGLDPGSHHLVSLGFHVANTLLLFAVLNRMMRLRSEASSPQVGLRSNKSTGAATPQAGAVWRSALVAALFALHPLHVESVAWLSERKDVLSTFFFLLTLGAYTRYAQKRSSVERRALSAGSSGLALNPQPSTLNYILALFFFALGLMSKPMLVTLPFVLLLLDYWPLGRISEFGVRPALRSLWAKDGSSELKHIFRPSTLNSLARRSEAKAAQPSTLLLEKLPFFGLAAVSCAVTYLGMQGGQHLRSAEQAPWGLRLANVPVSYARYLGKLVWPVDLAALYPMPAHWGFWPVGGSVVLLLLLTLFVAGRARSAPWLLTGWLMFLGTLVPVIGIVPNGFQSIADRYTYIPSIGLFVAGVWAVAEFSSRWKFRAFLLPGAAGLALLVCGSLTWLQAGYWRNSLTLWTHCVAVTRDNILARVSLGNALQQAGQINEAMEQYREVLRLDPNQEHANLDLGVALAMTGQLQEAANCFARALWNRPDWSGTHLNLGRALFELGDFSGALTHYAEAVRLDSNAVVAFTALAGDLSARGKSDEAVRYYLEALRFNPADAEAHYHLGLEWLQRGRMDEAMASLREAVRLEPDRADAHFQLATALANRRAISEAISQYHETLRLNPESLLALNNLAWILATHPEAQFRNGPEAVQLAERACELTSYQQTVFVGTLAAACAEAGRFDDAVVAAQKACALASGRGEPGLLQKNRELLVLYQAHQPYREPANR
jgi:tetratricopeptide (TPR) repeat protein